MTERRLTNLLKNLVIKNYALIKELEITPSNKLNIITGETGAGKSIMLGALGLLMGNRADTKVLFNDAEKCIIEGAFDISSYHLETFFKQEELDYDATCLIRREISPQNKSRAFINDTPVTLDILKALSASLMDIHSQHETLYLGNADFQISVVDTFAGNEALVKHYKTLYDQHKKLNLSLKELKEQSAEASRQMEFNTFQLNELTEAQIQAGEQQKLEDELRLLENSEELKSKLNLALALLSDSDNAVTAHLKIIEKSFEQISPLSETFAQLYERLKSCAIELKDIAAEAEYEEAKVDFSPAALEKIQERLSKIYFLQKKHQAKTEEELLVIQDELQEKVNKVTSLEEEITATEKSLQRLYTELIKEADAISAARTKTAPQIKLELEGLLKEVGMPDASVKILVDKTEPNLYGTDKVTLLFSANKGIAPQELKNVASGGELSRLMLCIKYVLAGKTALPTIIFDEIDTGISGQIAIQVGRMMKQMSNNHQIIAISHLPQIAASGNTHYYVYKDTSESRAVSRMKKLSNEERITEIAEMIGGKNPSESAVKNATELLTLN